MFLATIMFNFKKLTLKNKSIFFIIDDKFTFWFKFKDVVQVLHKFRLKPPPSRDIHLISFKNITVQFQCNTKRIPNNTYFIEKKELINVIENIENYTKSKNLRKWIETYITYYVVNYTQEHIHKLLEWYVKKNDAKYNLFQHFTKNAVQWKSLIEDICPKLKNELKNSQFVIVDVRQRDHEGRFIYYAIRAQKCSIPFQIEKIKKRFPGAEVILNINYYPNAINLFNRFKEKNKSEHTITFNNFIHTFLSPQKLSDAINIVFNERNL